MGRVYCINRLPKSNTAFVPCSYKTLETFHNCSSLTGHGVEAGFLRYLHIFSDGFSCKNPIFVNREVSYSDRSVLFAPHLSMFRVGFHQSLHFSGITQFRVEPITNKNDSSASVNQKGSDDVDHICRIVSRQSISTVTTFLDTAGISVSPALTTEVLKKLSNAGLLALSFFRWAERQEGFKHTTEIYNHLIEALGKIKQFRLIWGVVESMKQRALLSKDTFGLISRRYARARKIRDAVEAFEKMEMFGLKPDSADYNNLIDTISKSKNVSRAQEILYDLKRRRKLSPDLKTYTILLEGWGQEKNLTRMKEVYDEMIEGGFVPDVVTYGILVNAFCKCGKCDEALEVFRNMEENGCRPSPHIFCTLINGLGSEKRLNEALKFFELSKSCGHPPEVPTYNAVVGSYCWASRFEDAYRVVAEMKRMGIGPNVRTFDIVLHHLIRAGKTEEAYNVFQSMGRHGEIEPQLNTYTMMISMLCADERVDLAIRVWNEMSEKGILPCMHMFSALINGLCYENRLDEACHYFEEMLDKGIRPPGQLFAKLKETLLEGGKQDLAYMMAVKLDKLRKTPLNG